MTVRHYHVQWTQTAVEDLLAIGEYIGRDSEQAALAVSERLQERASSLCTLAERGRIVPELAERGIREYRELVCPPWRMIYRVVQGAVFVHAVLDARRGSDGFPFERLLDEGGTPP
jgi:addiction module RelE/StbE family toxin